MLLPFSTGLPAMRWTGLVGLAGLAAAAASTAYCSPTPSTLAAVRAVTELHVGIFRSAGWVVVREAWEPEMDDLLGKASRLKTLANSEPAPPVDEQQFELAAALAARVLRAPALTDPAGGPGIDFMYDHSAVTHLLDGNYVVVVIPTDLVCVGLQVALPQIDTPRIPTHCLTLIISQGVRSTILPSLESSADDSFETHEFELEAGDVLLFDSSACRGVPRGLGADHLLYRFAACDPEMDDKSRAVLWCTPPEIALEVMRTRL